MEAARLPVNTLEQALQLARALARDLKQQESKTRKSYRVFAALAPNDWEALAAFLIWKARGETIKEFWRRFAD